MAESLPNLKFCAEHWSRLRQAVDQCGLGHLVARDGEMAARLLERMFMGEAEELDFEPLLFGYFELYQLAMGVCGGMFVEGADKPYCPPCLLRDYDWIRGVAAEAREKAESLGLLLEGTGGRE